MEIRRFEGVKEFQAEVIDLIIQNEAENHLVLGLLSSLSKNKHHYSKVDPIFLGLYQEGHLSTMSMMTPPHNIILTRANEEELKFLADYIFEKRIEIPGVLGPNKETGYFSEYYSKKIGCSYRVDMNERIYQLDQVEDQKLPMGKMRLATMDEFPLLEKWAFAFYEDAQMPIQNPDRVSELFKEKVEEGSAVVWDNNGIKSMATFQGKTPNGIRVGYVYTPPEYRKNGYGGAVTNRLSQYLLDNGNRFCFLFTDLSNPTSNSIYKKIGYKEVCDFNMIKFIK